MDFNDWNERSIAERSWIETQELMQEFNIGPDLDSEIKQREIEALEAGLVVEVQEGLEEIPF